MAATSTTPSPPSKFRKIVDVDAKTMASFKWPLLAGECSFRDAAGDHWWVGEVDLWQGDALHPKLITMYGNHEAILIKLTSLTQLDIYDKTLTANITAGQGRALETEGDVEEHVRKHAVALDDDTVKNLLRR
jgi:hypothetical protein